MKRPFLRVGLIVGALTLSQTGCHQAAKTESASKASKSTTPDDPMAWSEKDLTKGDSDSGSTKSGLTKSSGLQGMMSDEGRDIENSLGVGRR